jgi:hypothetical protein
MASTAFTRAMLVRIKDAGGWKALLDDVAEGKPFTRVADKYGISRSFLANYMRRNAKLKELLAEARKIAAHVYIERATEAIEDADANHAFGREQIAKAKLQSDHYKWLASKYDREFFGDDKTATNVNLNLMQNFPDMHLQALRQLNSVPRQKQITSGGEPQPIDAEIINPEESNG